MTMTRPTAIKPFFIRAVTQAPAYLARQQPAQRRAQPCEQPQSVSESLACGLVSRLAAESVQPDHLRLQAACAIESTVKRDAAYGRACAWLARAIPDHLLILSKALYAPAHHRSSRDDRFLALHWTADPHRDCLVANLHIIGARKLEQRQTPILLVTMHALMRLFDRLRTVKGGAVLCELNSAARTALHWHGTLRRGQPAHDLLLPTPNGAVVVARDADSATGPAILVAHTWMSDPRMADNVLRLSAVRRARIAGGVVSNRAPFPLLHHPRDGLFDASSNRA